MPIEYPGGLDFAQDDVEKAQVLEIPLNPAAINGPNILFIYTGTTPKPLNGESSGQWSRARHTFTLPTDGRKWITDASPGAGIAPKIVFNGQPELLRIVTRLFPPVVR